MKERHKWVLVACLTVVLAVMLAHRFHHRRGPASRQAAAERHEAPPGAQPGPAESSSARSAPSIELARAVLERPPHAIVIPERDLFAPGHPRASGAAASSSGPAEPANVTSDDDDPAPPRFALTATFRDGGARMAILDGALVREGDRLASGYVLRRVEENRVILELGGRTLAVGMASK